MTPVRLTITPAPADRHSATWDRRSPA